MKYIIELFPKYSLYYLKLAFLMTLISQNTMYYLEKQLLGEEKFMNFFHFWAAATGKRSKKWKNWCIDP